MTTLSAERTALTEDLQLVCAGHTIQSVLCSLTDVLANSVGFAAEDLAAAERLIDELVPDMKATLSRNWDEIRLIRATAVNARGQA